MIKKFASFFCFLFIFFSSSLAPIHSQEPESTKSDFSANFAVSYLVAQDGKTKVTQKISLTNLTPNFYAKEYNLSIGSTKIDQVTAQDSIGKINASVTKTDKATAIKLIFNDKVVGQGKSLNFTLTYEVNDITSKNGLMWEITIPKLAISADIKDYNLELLVPESFGEIHYISPTPVEIKDGKTRTFRFSRDQLEKSGVSAAFGKYQLFDFELKYHLLNPNLFSAQAQISLPPDTNSQQVIFDSIDPAPKTLEVDRDGNYIATYELRSRQKIDIVAKGSIRMVEASHDLQTFPPLSADVAKDYLFGNRYWNLDPVIKNKAIELTEGLGEVTTDLKARALYDYVSTHLQYSYERLKTGQIERLGALGAINNPTSAICMEYTDLFIALARSLGIPAREVNGYAYTQNKDLRPTAIGGRITSDILHAWPEYYSFEKNRWIQIDPTWGSTTGGVDYFDKLDTNHITFVRKGYSSDEPIPAGAYKLQEGSSGDVVISPSTQVRDELPKLEIGLKESSYPAGLNNNATLIIKNIGKRSFFRGEINLSEETRRYVNASELVVPTILPGAQIEVNFKIKSPNLLESTSFALTGEVFGSDGNQDLRVTFDEPVHLKPFFTFGLVPLFFLTVLIGIGVGVYLLFRSEFKLPKKRARK